MISTIIIFVLVLGLLVFVHELGHFLMARKVGMKVEEFGIGFPPRLWSYQRGETRYSLNLIPLGGFVKIAGENGEEKDDPRSFINKKIWQIALVLIAGVSMNVFLAYFIMIYAFTSGLPHIIEGDLPARARIADQHVQILEIAADSPAAEAGLIPGDVLLAIDDQELVDDEFLQSYIKEKDGAEVSLTYVRNKQQRNIEMTPRLISAADYPVLGVVVAKTALVSYPWYISIWEALKNTFFLLWNILSLFGVLLYNLISRGTLSVDFSGPLGIAVMTGQVVDLGFSYLMRFVAILSLNLAIINIIPFPALDGGKLLFLLIEKLKGSPVNQKYENLIHNFGFMFLMLLIVFITYRDVLKFGGKIVGAFKQYF